VVDGEELENSTDPLNGEDDVPVTDTSDPVDTAMGDVKGGGGCGCATTPAPAPLSLAGLLGLLGAMWARRRR